MLCRTLRETNIHIDETTESLHPTNKGGSTLDKDPNRAQKESQGTKVKQNRYFQNTLRFHTEYLMVKSLIKPTCRGSSGAAVDDNTTT